jgi:hypothetical protein
MNALRLLRFSLGVVQVIGDTVQRCDGFVVAGEFMDGGVVLGSRQGQRILGRALGREVGRQAPDGFRGREPSGEAGVVRVLQGNARAPLGNG